MSSGQKVPWKEAYDVAESVANALKPVTARCKVAGSFRRRRPEVGDLEFVVEPLVSTDLTGTQIVETDLLKQWAQEYGLELKRAGPRMVQVTEVLGSRLSLDLFVVHPPAQWGCILGIRTGPPSLGGFVMGRMKENGFRMQNGGVVTRRGRVPVPVPDEETWFRMAGCPWLPPVERDAAVLAWRNDTPDLPERWRLDPVDFSTAEAFVEAHGTLQSTGAGP